VTEGTTSSGQNKIPKFSKKAGKRNTFMPPEVIGVVCGMPCH
jgi:hypothetical protein